jgi:nitrite reductase (NADH) small subunit
VTAEDDWVDVGTLDSVPEGGCRAAADDRVLLIRNGEHVAAYQNRCLHRDTPLHTGHLAEGTLVCPLHFWRYDLTDGRVVGGIGQLPRLELRVRDGRVEVVPPPPPPVSISALLRAHATTWSRDADPDPSTLSTDRRLP